MAVETFPSFPRSALTGVVPRRSRAPTRSPLLPLLLRDSSPNACHSPGLPQPQSESLPKPSNPPPPVRPGGHSHPPACGSAREPRGLAGSSPRAGGTREASEAGRAATLLTLRSLRAAWRGCGARCGVRDPGRCGPSRCWPRRGLGLGGGASLLGWERPAGQGGSEPAKSPPRPTAAGGGPASPGRFHLRVGPCLRAPRRRPPVPAPAAARSQSAAKGRRAAARSCEGGGGADWARDARHARSAWAPAARCAPTESRANFSGGAVDHSAPRFPKPLPALWDPARPGSAHSARSSAPPPHGWPGRPERARGGRRSSRGRRARAPTHPAPWPCREPGARSRLCHLALQK